MTGLEPAASGVTGRRSNQLSYTPAIDRPSDPADAKACGLRQRTGLVKQHAPATGTFAIAPSRQSERRREMVGGERLELPTSTV